MTRSAARSPIAWLAARARVGAPGRSSAGARRLVRLLGPLTRLLFRPVARGWERLPRDRPCLVVANHSGGGVVDVLCLAHLALEHDPDPRLTGMAHPVAFHVPAVAWLLRGLGAVPSSYEHARKALDEGLPVLVFPGGDHEAFRPLWHARRVDFAGRRGFLRLARAAGVPIVPVGIWGTHLTQPILWRSGLLPWLSLLPRGLGIKRLPVTVPWLAGLVAIAALLGPHASPWATAGAALLWSNFLPVFFLPLVPWPVRVCVGPPLAPEDLFEGDDDRLDEPYARVVAAVQAAVDEAREGSGRPS
ncbi:MAG: acyltransferase family protein [Planctomycetes bacterium]|nr:acyltransferase family protein [Planctomycetota bacterium]